ncbi:MAG: hypothetical protein ACREOE_00875 [Gemmatimonadales bacterium]
MASSGSTSPKSWSAPTTTPTLRNLAAGQYIHFACGQDACLVQVKRVARYASVEEMLDTEGPANVNPDSDV